MHILLWRLIVNLFKITWRIINFIRTCVLNLFLIFFIIIGIGFWNKIGNAISMPAPKGALKLNISGVIVDKSIVGNRMSKIGYQLLGNKNGRSKENVIFNLITAIRQAKNDKNITGIVLDLHNFMGGSQSSLEYIGKALNEFRKSGKPIYALGDNYTQSQYYLASYANKIYLSPQGSVDLHGFSINNLYYKKLLDKLKIHSNIFRIGTYKSAVEPFLRNNMSSEAREDYSSWINQLWKEYINKIAKNRNIDVSKVFPSAEILIKELNKIGGNTAQYALNNKLVDNISSRGEVDQILINYFGLNKKHNDYRNISIYDYKIIEHKKQEDANVAVILVNGPIIDGSTIDNSDSNKIANQIRDSRLNEKIKAIILRINSPGGSVAASEMIREELEAFHKAGKIIVVSMGGIAASGGYWISTAADYIIAHPTTLTGSIGIFGVVNTLEETLDNIGIHSDGVYTSPLANKTIAKNISKEKSQLIEINIKNGYRNFINIVASSRHKTANQIEDIAQGKIWTGNDAKKNGLIDKLGDFDDAMQKTMELAKLSKINLKWYLNERTFLNIFLNHSNIYNVVYKIFNVDFFSYLDYLFNMFQNNELTKIELKEQKKIYSICLNCNNPQ